MAQAAASLRRRVAWAAALAAALGGAVAAGVAGLAAHELVRRHEEAALRDAVLEMAGELREALEEEASGEHAARSMDARLAHELDDLKLRGASASLQHAGRTIAGDRALPAATNGECREQGTGAKHLRLCALAFAADTLVLAVRGAPEAERSALITRALWIGLLSGALLGGLSSYLIAAWALLPLTTLRDRVRAVSADKPAPDALAGRAKHAEIEELRAAIKSLIERLASSLDQARAFAAEAAHELRTPLTTIAGELELLAETLSGEAPERAAVARVRAQVATLIALVQRLLVLARPEASAAHALEVLDLADVVAAARAGLSAPQAARVETQIEEDVLVRGEPTLLIALCTNALDNALKFSRDAITVRVTRAGDEARIDVLDRGPGIRASERERVFTPFYRTPEARAGGSQGQGLGLSLIAKVAALHAGRAEFVPSERGAHLRVSLPRFRGSAGPSI